MRRNLLERRVGRQGEKEVYRLAGAKSCAPKYGVDKPNVNTIILALIGEEPWGTVGNLRKKKVVWYIWLQRLSVHQRRVFVNMRIVVSSSKYPSPQNAKCTDPKGVT